MHTNFRFVQAVLIDMEDSVVARFRKGPLRKLFDETLLLTNYPGSGNNWYDSQGLILKEKVTG